MPRWLLLQIADSAFPAGGFAHSAGLEAMVQAGAIDRSRGVADFARDVIWQTACGALPFVRAAHSECADVASLDALSEVTLWSSVANRASRTQGRAFVDSAARSFGGETLASLRARVSSRELHGHVAPLFGAVSAAIGLDVDEASEALLHTSLRGALSAAVRLGVLGPYESQSIHHALRGVLSAAMSHAETLSLDDVAQTSPVAELFQATHDRLYSRLFQS
jgi:urease accessory protein